jgi:hypothetical protein
MIPKTKKPPTQRRQGLPKIEQLGSRLNPSNRPTSAPSQELRPYQQRDLDEIRATFLSFGLQY